MSVALHAALADSRVRYLLAGVSTTAFSYLLYVLLLWPLPPLPAYVLAYVAGIAWAYTVNSVWVFRGRWRWRGLAAYPLVYLAQALLSFALFALLVGRWGLHPLWAPLVTVVVMLPVGYWAGRAIVRLTSRHATTESRPIA